MAEAQKNKVLNKNLLSVGVSYACVEVINRGTCVGNERCQVSSGIGAFVEYLVRGGKRFVGCQNSTIKKFGGSERLDR